MNLLQLLLLLYCFPTYNLLCTLLFYFHFDSFLWLSFWSFSICSTIIGILLHFLNFLIGTRWIFYHCFSLYLLTVFYAPIIYVAIFLHDLPLLTNHFYLFSIALLILVQSLLHLLYKPLFSFMNYFFYLLFDIYLFYFIRLTIYAIWTLVSFISFWLSCRLLLASESCPLRFLEEKRLSFGLEWNLGNYNDFGVL